MSYSYLYLLSICIQILQLSLFKEKKKKKPTTSRKKYSFLSQNFYGLFIYLFFITILILVHKFKCPIGFKLLTILYLIFKHYSMLPQFFKKKKKKYMVIYISLLNINITLNQINK